MRASATWCSIPRDKSIWGIRHQNGFATIVRIPPPYAGFNQIHTFEYGMIPFDLDISPDGTHGLGQLRRDQRHPVGPRLEDADASRRAADPTRSRGSTCRRRRPEGFIFSPDGKSLYGTSYYTGVSNVFRFDIATPEI